MSQLQAKDVIAFLEQIAPPGYAMPDDRIGLQLGRMDKPVRKVALALDAYPKQIAEAIQSGADLLVTHHALIFRPLTQIDTATARGRAIAEVLRHDLTVYNAHTNLDIAEGGVNDVLAEILELTHVEVLDRMQSQRLRKLVVFVPESHHQSVLAAVCEAGAGHIGGYSHCTFNTLGTGTFLPEEGTHPFIGEPGQLERTAEVRLETIVPEPLVETVVQAMLAAHPYEEVAYDLYPLDIMGDPIGIGRVGDLKGPMRLEKFAETVRHKLQLEHLRFTGDPDAVVSRVAVLGGSGGRWVKHALAKGAEVLVTSDCDHHTVAEAWQDGLAVVDATHAAMELPVLRRVQEQLLAKFGDALEVAVVRVPEDPFRWV